MIFKRAEQYVNDYKKQEREEIRLKRQAKANGDFYVPAQPKVYFVMRIKGCVTALVRTFEEGHELTRISFCIQYQQHCP